MSLLRRTVEVVTNYDCIVCHAEGKMDSGDTTKTAATAFHGNGVVDLLNVDDANNWKGAGNDPAGAMWTWTGKGATPTATERANLDAFCLSCHDADGALATYNMNPADTWHTATYTKQPFGKADVVGSSTDGQLRCTNGAIPAGRAAACVTPSDGVQRGNVIDVKSQFNPAGSHIAGTWTKFSYHALKYFNTSRYSTSTATAPYVTITSAGRFLTAAPGAAGAWGCQGAACTDTSQLYCSDCHRVDYSSHGSQNAEYMNKCTGGSANLATCTADSSDVFGGDLNLGGACFRCHNIVQYGRGSKGTHTGGSGSDWVEAGTPGTTPATRVVTGGTGSSNLFQGACLNCHGGYGFGEIHGTSQTIPIANAASTRKAWRFMNGAAHNESVPSGGNTSKGERAWVADTGNPATDLNSWSNYTNGGSYTTGRMYTCYTMGAAPENTTGLGGCTQHSGGTTNNANMVLNRKLDY